MGGADGSDLKEEGEGGAGGTGRAGQGPERLRRGGKHKKRPAPGRSAATPDPWGTPLGSVGPGLAAATPGVTPVDATGELPLGVPSGGSGGQRIWGSPPILHPPHPLWSPPRPPWSPPTRSEPPQPPGHGALAQPLRRVLFSAIKFRGCRFSLGAARVLSQQQHCQLPGGN